MKSSQIFESFFVLKWIFFATPLPRPLRRGLKKTKMNKGFSLILKLYQCG